MDIRIGKDFDSLAKRVLYSYAATYPRFVPARGGAREEAQRAFHDMMRDALIRLYQSPEILGLPEEKDDCYGDWELNNARPELIKAMEKIEYTFAGFIEQLIKLGRLGRLEGYRLVVPKAAWTPGKAVVNRLAMIGVDIQKSKDETVATVTAAPSAVEAWKRYADADNEKERKITRAMHFIHARYDDRVYTADDFFGELVGGGGALRELESYLGENGFRLTNCDPGAQTRYSLARWEKQYPKKEYASMRVYFNWRKRHQLTYEFRLPQFRMLLERFGDMDAPLARFVFGRLKDCDGCGYCTQTDKTGKRQRLATALECDGESRLKCPLYPNLTWFDMDERAFEDMRALFAFSEEARR